MTQPIAASHDLKHTLNLILDQLAIVLEHHSAAILLLTPGQIEVVVARGHPAPARAQPVTHPLVSSPLLDRILHSPQPVILDGDFADEPFARLICRGPGYTCANVPLRVQNNPIGILTVNRHGTGGYTAAECELLATFAQQVALTIENVRLYEDTHRRALQLEAAAQVGKQLTLLQDLDQLLAESVRVICQTFGYYQAHILLIDPARSELVLREAHGPGAKRILAHGLRLKVGVEGITGWVAQQGEPILCNDVLHESRFLPVELLPETRSELAVPLRLRGRAIGVLDVQNDRPHTFQQEDILALQLIADQVAIAIENARLFAETKQRLEAMHALHAVSLDIVAQLEISELLNTLLERAARLVQAEGAALAIHDESSGTIRNIASYQTWRDWTGSIMRPGEGIFGYVLKTGQSVIVDDYERWPHAAPQFIPSAQPIMLAVPLNWRDRLIGALLVLNRAGGHVFTSEDQRALSAFADLTSIALKNAELYAQVKSFSQTLEAQVAERTSELVSAQRQLMEKAEQVQWLLSKTVQIQEEERARIARDLHDSVTQLTIGAMLELQAAKADMNAGRRKHARAEVDDARELLKQIEREIRQAIFNLRPVQLDASGLQPALQKYAESFQDLTGLRCVIESSGTPMALPPPVEVVIFRIVQEALHNVMTHAHAQTVRVSLAFSPKELTLTIEDDGQGFDLAATRFPDGSRHIGLTSMRERAHVIGGELEVWSQPAKGTRITFKIGL